MAKLRLRLLLLGIVVTLTPLIVFAEDVSQTVAIENNIERGFVETSGVIDGLTVDLEVTPKNPVTGESATLKFFVNEKPVGNSVTDLEIEHERFLHVMGVRDDLSEFFHIHPAGAEDGLWTVEHVFENPGAYKVWTDIRRDGETQSFGHKKISVSGGGDFIGNLPEFSENVIIENYQVDIDLHDEFRAGENTEINFILSDVFGRSLELEPYLGADMHLAIIKNDLKAFIHTHPSISNVKENDLANVQLSFTTTFPEEGVYKMFAQFRPNSIELPTSEALVAEFYINVKQTPTSIIAADDEEHFVGDGHTDHAHKPVAKVPWYQSGMWWTFFLISLLLMSVFSWGVYKYIEVKD